MAEPKTPSPPRRRSAAAADMLALARSAPPAKRRVRKKSASERAVRDAIDTIDGTVHGMVERGKVGSLSDRDPNFIRSQMAWMRPLVNYYFRGEARHLDRIPKHGPVLCVANHSGGLVTPDSWVLTVKFYEHFGVRRTSYGLAHNLVMGVPGLGEWLRKMGSLPAHPDNARAALEHGAVVLVYPGGDEDVFRPYKERNRIHLARRTGFVRIALQERVPIVPIVSVGGHETAFILGDGRRIAEALRLERFRIKSLPLVVAPPWGVSPGDLLLHFPLPAKIVVEAGEPIDFYEEFGALDPRDPEVVWACYRLVEKRMQAQLDALAAERRFPIFG